MSDEKQFVTVETDAEGIAVIRIDRPMANALSREVLRQLGAIAKNLVESPPKAVVIHGGERIFAAGADISEFGGTKEAEEMGALFRDSLDAIAAIPRVTIAAINGFALGGGCEIALACDFRVASSNAKMGQPEILLGIIPGGGGTQRLPRLIGIGKARELIFSGRQVSAEEALAIGLIDKTCEPGSALEESLRWATTFARGAVIAQGLAKKAIDLGAAGSLSDGLALEQRLFAEVFSTADSQIGVNSFLNDGPGKAVFSGS